MANTVQIKRGNNAAVNSYTGPSGEVIYNLDTGRLHTQDGSIAGGAALALLSDVSGGDVTSVNTQTGDVVLGKGDIGLGNVDNTSDANKPISTATQTALNTKAGTAVATTTVNGLMAAADKVKLNGIAAGAQVNTVASVNSKTGAVVLNAADVGAATAAQGSKADSAVQTVNGIAPTSGNVNVSAADVRLEDTVSSASSTTFKATDLFVRTSGFSTVGDGGGALYKRVSSEPSHAGKFQSTGGIWWELSYETKDIRAMGVKFDGVWSDGDIYTGTDNTVAINNALSFKDSWDFPSGICLTQGNHIISGQITGAGIWQTTIVCTNSSPNTKIFTIHTLARIDRFRMIYNGNVNVTSATDNQFIALSLGTASLPLCKGGGYGNISIGRCGTGVWSGDNHTFACRLDNLELREFYHIGVDVMSGLRTPNYWGNIYMNGSPTRISCHVGIRIGGAYSDGDFFGVVHIESINCNAAIQQYSTTGTRFEILHLEDVNQKATDRCFFEHRDGATCNYGRVSIWYCVIKNNCSFFGGYDAKRNGGGSSRTIAQNGFINIQHLEVTGLFSDEARTLPVNTVTGFKYFENYTGESGGGIWFVRVQNYTWYSFGAGDDAWYRNPNLSPETMIILQFGPAKIGGLKTSKTITSSATLDRTDSIVIVGANSGNITITLPKTVPGMSQELIFKRVDATGNTVSFAAQSGDSASAVPALAAGDGATIVSDGFTSWIKI